jgi:hypothetical protein
MNPSRWITLIVSLCTALDMSTASASKWGTNSKAQHIVNRTYQLVYGSVDMCRRYSPREADAVIAESRRFKLEYPDFITALERSPYFPQAKKNMDEDIDEMAQKATKDPKLAMCQEYILMLKQFIDQPCGKQAVEEMLLDLGK